MGLMAFHQAQLDQVLRGILNHLVNGRGFYRISEGESTAWLVRQSRVMIDENIQDAAFKAFLLKLMTEATNATTLRNAFLHDALMGIEPDGEGLRYARSRRGQRPDDLIVVDRKKLDEAVSQLALTQHLAVLAVIELMRQNKPGNLPRLPDDFWEPVDAGTFAQLGIHPGFGRTTS